MTTPAQEAWLATLSDDDAVDIFPFDPSSAAKFEIVRRKIVSAIGDDIRVEFCGASSLGISGQGDLDVYLPVPVSRFAELQPVLEGLFGKPRSVHPDDRIRFVTFIDGTKTEVFIINEKGMSWIQGVTFEGYLKRHPEALLAYERLKESLRGRSTRQYYRNKIVFINDIMEKAKKEAGE